MVRNIAIVGATGLQGSSILKTLYNNKHYRICGVTRSIDSDKVIELSKQYPKVIWVVADLDDKESLKAAFTGIDIVFGVTYYFDPFLCSYKCYSSKESEEQQGRNLVDAAIEKGVNLMIYSSVISFNKISHGKFPDICHVEAKHSTEEYLTSKSYRIYQFFISLGFYMECFPRFSRIASDGVTVEFCLPMKPDTMLPLVDTANDVGPVVEYILDNPGETYGTIVEISSGYYEVQDMAKAFTKVTGRPSRYVQIPYEQLDNHESIKLFKAIEEFGLFGGRHDFIERNAGINHEFGTPVTFWQNRNWSGP